MPGVLTLTLNGVLLVLCTSRGRARDPGRGNLGPARVRRDGDDAATLTGRRDDPAAATSCARNGSSRHSRGRRHSLDGRAYANVIHGSPAGGVYDAGTELVAS